jgi:crossover junction endodeoxyribonuclease RusA
MSEERAISIRVDNLPLPPRECSPNARVHWVAKAAAVRDFRADCGILIAQVAMRAPRRLLVTPVVITLDIYCGHTWVGDMVIADGRYRPKDVDNALAACKPLIDAIVDAGVIPDDSTKHVRRIITTIHPHDRSKRSPSGIILRVLEPGVPVATCADLPNPYKGDL